MCVVWKFFPIFCRYLCVMFGVVLLVTFIMLVIYPLFIAVAVVSYLCVYLICWVPVYAHSWINIYRGWTNNGNTRQYRNKTLCWLHWKNISCICAVPVSMHYRLCLVTVRMKVMQMGGLTDIWCAFRWRVGNRNGHFIRCIQSNSFQGCEDIHSSWEDIISWGE